MRIAYPDPNCLDVLRMVCGLMKVTYFKFNFYIIVLLINVCLSGWKSTIRGAMCGQISRGCVPETD